MKHSTHFTYLVGFLLSVMLTLASFVLVEEVAGTVSQITVIGIASVFAIVQICVQLYTFVHITQEESPRWKAQALILAALFLLILVVGSLWIMNNLNDLMMSPQVMDRFMLER